ncbi:hypothetical protein [Pseudochryseolinea flava]|uniref:hypothetical protein n=1 Tax=Pseudochryseolinea flava TaxID=2059302 RepID=UPI001401D941|nr:hypothetical protein [Pseudochryseolinea flava]
MNSTQVKTLISAPAELWNEKQTKTFKLSQALKSAKRYFSERILFTLLGDIKK